MADEDLEPLSAGLAERYLIEERLGRGATATVFLAADLRHGRRVALKVLNSALGAALGAERFHREIRLHARLQHPHILPLYDSGAVAGRLFFTMPYVETGSLRDRLDREGPLPLPHVLHVASQVAEALAYAHALGIVHRDIKPENILLSVTGDAMLADFGIAWAVDQGGPREAALPAENSDGEAHPRLTQAGVALGTPAYMSPEQSEGEEVDGRSDIYALASVIYETLAGALPFPGRNARAIIARRLTEPPPSVREARPEVPVGVDLALGRAMRRQATERFETVSEFADALVAGMVPEEVAPLPAPPAAWPLRRMVAPLLVFAGLLIGAFAAWRMLAGSAGLSGQQMVAVLPFKNLGPPGDQYFADGLTEEITNRLAGLSGMRVISRTSADQYRSTSKSLREIGEELGAGYVLEGSVRWDRTANGPGRVRVTPQLIRVKDDSHLWSEQYDAELTEVFGIQASIAERVTSALDVALRAPERTGLAAGTTRNPEAYDHYLRGNEYLGRSNELPDITAAADLFEKAVALDPRFALALARLSRAYSAMYWFYHDKSETRLALARAAADSALRLVPDLPEGRIALGLYYYWGHLDYQRALAELERARRRQPSNSDLLSAIGYVERRRGRWNDAIARFTEALRYDPRSNVRAMDIGDTYFSIRLYREAERSLDRAITLSPDWATPYAYKANLYLVWRGDLPRARAVLGQALARLGPGRLAPAMIGAERVSASLLTADSLFAPMVDALTPLSFAGDSARYYLLKAEASYFRRRTEQQHAYADSALGLLESALRGRPNDARLQARLGLAYAFVNRRADALRAGRRAVELLPISLDANSGPFMLSNLARIHVLLGEFEEAIGRLEPLLRIPCWISPAELRADPVWAPLRSHPRFQQLIQDSTTTA